MLSAAMAFKLRNSGYMAEPQTSHNVSLIREMLLRLRLRLSCSTYTRQGSHTHRWKLGVPSWH